MSDDDGTNREIERLMTARPAPIARPFTIAEPGARRVLGEAERIEWIDRVRKTSTLGDSAKLVALALSLLVPVDRGAADITDEQLMEVVTFLADTHEISSTDPAAAIDFYSRGLSRLRARGVIPGVEGVAA